MRWSRLAVSLVTLAGCPERLPHVPEPITLLAGHASGPDFDISERFDIAADEDWLYIAAPDTRWQPARPEGAILRLRKEGGAPVALVSALAAPCAVAVDDLGVVFADGPRVMTTTKEGGAAFTLATDPGGEVRQLALAGGEVYWASETGVHAILRDGSGAARTLFTGAATSLAVQGDSLLVSAADGLYRAPRSGAVAARLLAPVAAPIAFGALAVAGDTAYALRTMHRVDGVDDHIWCEVHRVSGDSVTPMVSTEAVPRTAYCQTVLADAVGVLFSDGYLISDAPQPLRLVADGTSGFRTAALVRSSPLRLVADDRALYYVTCEGEVLRIDRAALLVP